MSAPHFIAPSVAGDGVVLHGEEARHAVRVLRVRDGESITVTDGAGSVVRATVVEAAATLTARVEERWSVPAPRPALEVWQAIPKAGKLDTIVRQLTEIGVAAVVLFAAERSVARWDGAKAAAKVAHLRAVAREAVKQSRRAWIPDVRDVAPLSACEPPAIALHEEEGSRLSGALPPEAPERLALVVGPEGGLSSGDVQILRERGALPAGLGPGILRTETAALVACSVVLARYGLIG